MQLFHRIGTLKFTIEVKNSPIIPKYECGSFYNERANAVDCSQTVRKSNSIFLSADRDCFFPKSYELESINITGKNYMYSLKYILLGWYCFWSNTLFSCVLAFHSV